MSVTTDKSPREFPGGTQDYLDSTERSIVMFLNSGPKSTTEIRNHLEITRPALYRILRRLLFDAVVFKYKSSENHVVLYDLVVRQIRVMCPRCQRISTIKVETQTVRDVLDMQAGGLFDLTIFPGEICEHALGITIDHHFKARNVEVTC